MAWGQRPADLEHADAQLQLHLQLQPIRISMTIRQAKTKQSAGRD